MKKKPVDYSGFSLRRITDPRFSHLLLLLGWVGYFLLYFLTENLIPPEKCHVIHCALDDRIPFNEYFLFFYCGWYALVFGSLAFTLFFDRENFKRIQIYIIITQIVAMAWYIIWPSRQDLRPDVFERSNVLTSLMAFIYSFDTPTGVCPSLHVAYSLGILSTCLKDPDIKTGWKVLLTVFVGMICISVCFVKQHSAVDILAALPVCILAEILVFWKPYWKHRLRPLHSSL